MQRVLDRDLTQTGTSIRWGDLEGGACLWLRTSRLQVYRHRSDVYQDNKQTQTRLIITSTQLRKHSQKNDVRQEYS